MRSHNTTRLVDGRVVAVVAAGGALGSAARWGLSRLLPPAPGAIPWGTWLANVSGGLALGVLMVLVLERWPNTRYLRPFVGVGVLGGYTTFSSWMLETRGLLASGHVGVALAYAGLTLIVGFLAVWFGVMLGGGLAGRRLDRRLVREPRR